MAWSFASASPVEAAGPSPAVARHHGVLVLARARDPRAGRAVLADNQAACLAQYPDRGSGRPGTRPGPDRFRGGMPFAAPATPACSRLWLTGPPPADTAVLIAAPPHPVGIGEFGERGDISIGAGCYRLRAQVRELGERRVLARADNAQLPEQVTVVWNIGHTSCLGIFNWDTSGVVPPDTTSVSPHIHVRDRPLTTVMNLDPQHLAGPAQPLDLHFAVRSSAYVPTAPAARAIAPNARTTVAYAVTCAAVPSKPPSRKQPVTRPTAAMAARTCRDLGKLKNLAIAH